MNRISKIETDNVSYISEIQPPEEKFPEKTLWRVVSTSSRSKRHNRRAIQRFRARNDAFAFMRSFSAPLEKIGSMSMGDIALAVFRTNPSKAGQVRDISLAGMAFSYVASDSCKEGPCVLDLLMAESGFYLKNLRYTVVSDIRISDDPDSYSITTKRISVRFKDITPSQTEKLIYFLKNYTIGSA